jgi:hypothetical protein
MEGCGRDGGCAGLVQEAGVGFYARELFAFEVEDFDGVCAGTAIRFVSMTLTRAKGFELTLQIREDVRAYLLSAASPWSS